MPMFATLEQLVAVELDPEREVCPFCGRNYIIEGTTGAKHGVCPSCYAKAKIAGIRSAMKQHAVSDAYDAARQQKSRAVKAGEVSPDIPRNCKLNFDALR